MKNANDILMANSCGSVGGKAACVRDVTGAESKGNPQRYSAALAGRTEERIFLFRLAPGREPFPIHAKGTTKSHSICQRHYASAGDDEGPSQEEQRSGFLAESEPGNQLRHHEEKSHVHAQEPPEIPGRRVDRVPIKGKDEATKYEEEGGPGKGRAVHPHTHQSITAGFQAGGTQQQHHRQTVSQRSASSKVRSTPRFAACLRLKVYLDSSVPSLFESFFGERSTMECRKALIARQGLPFIDCALWNREHWCDREGHRAIFRPTIESPFIVTINFTWPSDFYRQQKFTFYPSDNFAFYRFQKFIFYHQQKYYYFDPSFE